MAGGGDVPETYRDLPQAHVALDFLKSNSSTHSYLFGAMAELVDNSRDAGATRMKIYCEETPNQARNVRGKVVYFVDNGCGMDPDEVRRVMTFGHSLKRGRIEMSGQYGNGLKSGAFRLGTDIAIFSKQGALCTCAMISKTFLERESVTECIVFPAPSWVRLADGTYKVNFDQDDAAACTRYDVEMDLIKTYSPFGTYSDVTAVFDAIGKQDDKGGSDGTAIVIYNLQKDAHGRTELRFEETDIKIEREIVGSDADSYNSYYKLDSLKEFLSYLYRRHRMLITVQRGTVAMRLAETALAKHIKFYTEPSFMRELPRKRTALAKQRLDIAVRTLAQQQTKWDDFCREHTPSARLDRDDKVKRERQRLQAARMRAEAEKEEAETAHQEVKKKASRGHEKIELIFGLNIENRHQCGAMVYNNGRLIRMFEKPRVASAQKSLGIVCIVDLPFALMEPKSDKQGFVSENEYGMLMKEVDSYTELYREEKDMLSDSAVKMFWQKFGYRSMEQSERRDGAPNDATIARNLIELRVQCGKCFKLRRRQDMQPKFQLGVRLPEKWHCAMVPRWSCADGEKEWTVPSSDKTPRTVVKAQRAAQFQKSMAVASAAAATAKRKAQMADKARQQAAKEAVRVNTGINSRQRTVRLSAPESSASSESGEHLEQEGEEEESDEDYDRPAARRAAGRQAAKKNKKRTASKSPAKRRAPSPPAIARLTSRQAANQSKGRPPARRRVASTEEEEESSDDEAARRNAEQLQKQAMLADQTEKRKLEQQERRQREVEMKRRRQQVHDDGGEEEHSIDIKDASSPLASGTLTGSQQSVNATEQPPPLHRLQHKEAELPIPSPDALTPDLSAGAVTAATAAASAATAPSTSSKASTSGATPPPAADGLDSVYRSVARQLYFLYSSGEQRELTDDIARQLSDADGFKAFSIEIENKLRQTVVQRGVEQAAAREKAMLASFNAYLRAAGLGDDEVRDAGEYDALLAQWAEAERRRNK